MVGIFINLIPLLIKFATKADRSLTIPPPKAIIQSDLLKLIFKIFSISIFACLKLFAFSFAVILYIFTSYFFKDLYNLLKNILGIFLSEIITIFFTLGIFFLIIFPIFFKTLLPI